MRDVAHARRQRDLGRCDTTARREREFERAIEPSVRVEMHDRSVGGRARGGTLSETPADGRPFVSEDRYARRAERLLAQRRFEDRAMKGARSVEIEGGISNQVTADPCAIVVSDIGASTLVSK